MQNINMLTREQQTLRMNIRNFLLVATSAELEREKELSLEHQDWFRARCIQELIEEERKSQ